MSNINFEESYLPKFENTPTDLACWRAREILGAFMLEGVDVADESIPDAAPEDYVEYLNVDDDAILHETTYIEINDGQRLNLSNRPFIEDKFGKLHSYTWPGYIAIHIEDKDAPPTYSPPDSHNFRDPVHRNAVLPQNERHQNGDDCVRDAVWHGEQSKQPGRIFFGGKARSQKTILACVFLAASTRHHRGLAQFRQFASRHRRPLACRIQFEIHHPVMQRLQWLIGALI